MLSTRYSYLFYTDINLRNKILNKVDITGFSCFKKGAGRKEEKFG